MHVYATADTVEFLQATNLYHPQTVAGSLRHSGEGEEPGLKDRDGRWDLRPHHSRIVTVTDETLATWHAVLEDESVPVRQSRMVYAVNRSTAAVLDKLSKSKRIGDLGLEFSSGWHEKNDRTEGFFDVAWGPIESWDDAILQGPHIFVGNPFYKSPNETMLHNLDWSPIDLETLTLMRCRKRVTNPQTQLRSTIVGIRGGTAAPAPLERATESPGERWPRTPASEH